MQVDTRVVRAWVQRSKLKYDEAFSNFAFKFYLRRYNWENKDKMVECHIVEKLARFVPGQDVLLLVTLR